MGRIWMPGGGGGADLDVTTAVAGDILKGKVIVGPDGEPLTGTLELTGNAADSQVLAGKTYYNTDAKSKRTGTLINRGAVLPGGLNAGGSYTIPEGYHNGAGKVTANSLASQTDGTAVAGDMLSGKTAWVKGSKITGNVVNQGAKTASLNCGGSYTIPAGFHNGSGKVTANSLASQTDATAAAGDILSGKTAWVKGSKITGNVAVQSILSFSAAPYGAKQVTFTWKNPAKGPFSGVIIVYKTGSYPSSITDGTRIYKGAGNNSSANGTSSATCTMPSENTTYYFRAYSYAIKNNAEWIHGTTYTATATTARSQYTFTASGTFTVPTGVSKIDIFCVGGGGGGGGGLASNSLAAWGAGGGGGGGYTATKTNISVTAGSKYSVTIGAGGSGCAGSDSYTSVVTAGDGGVSSVGSLISANGGKGGRSGRYSGGRGYGGWGGNGGSGGGAGSGTFRWTESEEKYYSGRPGGSNGANGPEGFDKGSGVSDGGTGQQSTTRAFGSSSGTLYAGGGASGCVFGYATGTGGSGGGGNGGTGSGTNGSAGTAGTGGGGGGGIAGKSGGGNSNNAVYSAGGAGGCGVVIIKIAA